MWYYIGESWLLNCLSPESFLANLFWCLFKVHKEDNSLVYSSQGSRDYPMCVFTTGELRLPVYSLLGSWDSLVYSSPGSHFGLGSCLPILRSIDNLQKIPRSPPPGVFITGESGLSGVFMIGVSFRTPGSRFINFKELQQSLKGLSF